MNRPFTQQNRFRFGSSRRQFLTNVAGIAAVSGFPRLLRAAGEPTYPFQEIPPEKSGIRWTHTSGKSAARFLPETTGPGCAFFDYDNDGWMDIYLVNSGKCDFYDPNPPLRNALYRNNRDGSFTDVTEKAGIPGGGYGQGVAVGDYDGDGFPDVYVTQYGKSILYHNNGDGTFSDVTEKAGVAAPGWSSSAVWFDYDNDGKLDLFVCQFVEFSKTINKSCGPGEEGKHGYCIPRLYNSMPSWLFHNNGDGTFSDVTKSSGIASSHGKAWGVVATDLNNDGQIDLFVSNDTAPNFVFMNRGKGKFEETGTYAGVAYSSEGRARSGMGLDSADFNQDGWMDLFVANIDMERFSIYQNNHDETYDDQAGSTGIGMATRLMSGWGLKFFDYDNDGFLDLFLANGNPDDIIESIHSQVKYQEPLMLFHSSGKSFQNVSSQSGPVFQKPLSARGMAIGDFDNDGAVDVLVAVNDGAPLLLRNAVGSQNHWLGVNLVGTKSNPDAIGARLVYKSGDMRQERMKVGGGSFLSSHDPRIVLGIGKRTKVDSLEIQWPQPGGKIERITDLPIDRYVTIVEGTGKWK